MLSDRIERKMITMFELWLLIVKEVRTALTTDPFPFETVRSLLETV